MGLYLYTFEDIKNFAIIDSPGDNENNQNLEYFAEKGCQFSKMLIYIISEENILSLKDHRKLKELVKLRIKYKIPLLIILTNSDNYCNKVKQSSDEWKTICKKNINNNKEILINYINEQIKKVGGNNFKIEESNIIHAVLVEPKEIRDDEVKKSFNEEELEEYNNANDEEKKIMLKYYRRGMQSKENEIKNFIQKEINVFGQNELIEKIKEKIPSQYHNALSKINKK